MLSAIDTKVFNFADHRSPAAIFAADLRKVASDIEAGRIERAVILALGADGKTIKKDWGGECFMPL